MAIITNVQSRYDTFAASYLKISGDLREKSIQRYHLASDVFASGVFASGFFDYIKIDGPTTAGYALLADVNGWGTWQQLNHSTLSNLTWSTAGHTINSNIVPIASGLYSVGTQAIPFSQVNAGTVRADYGYFTNISGGGGGGSGESIRKDIFQVGHGFVVGDLIRLSGTTYIKAQADSAANAEVVGIVESKSTDNFTLLYGGYMGFLSGLTAGAVHFLSDTVAGAMTATEPSTEGHISKPVFIAFSTTAGYFFNMRGLEINAVPSLLTAKYGSFINGDLVANVLTVTHNFGHKHVVPVIWDNSDNYVDPKNFTAFDNNTLKIDFTGLTIAGTWYYVILDVGGSTLHEMSDTDGDTKIELEKNPDEDIIRFTAAGTQEAQIDVNGLTLKSGTSVNELSIDGTLGGNSDDAVPTEKAVKTYADTKTIAPATNTADYVPQWNGTNSKTLKNGLAVGTAANNLVQLNGSAQLPAVSGALLTNLPASQGVPTGVEVFTVDGTWHWAAAGSPAKVWVKVWGAGASGGGHTVPIGTVGSGGGGGAYAEAVVSVSADVTVTVGTGGANPGPNANGNDGESSSFGTSAIAGGGIKGLVGTTGGAGGTASAGDMQINGQGGGNGTNTIAGDGGSAPFGGEGGGSTGTTPLYGGGGSGEMAGANGLVIVYW